MKFTNGLWLSNEDYKIQCPKEIQDIRHSDAGITLLALYEDETEAGRKIDAGGILSIRISALAANMLTVKITNRRGIRAKRAFFEINRGSVTPVSSETETDYVYASGSLEAHFSKTGEWGISFWYAGQFLTSTGADGLAYITSKDGQTYIRERLHLDAGECIYGFGERFSPLIRNGQSFDIWNENAQYEAEQAGKNIPFFLSTKNYGVLIHSEERISCEIGSESVNASQFSIEGETLEYTIIGGDSLKHILTLYSEIVGKPSLPPAWSLGPILGGATSDEETDESVLDTIDGMIDQGIPLSVFHFDASWMKNYEWTSFMWDRNRFPDPAGMMRKIHERGVRICVYITPFISQKSPLFQEGLDGNYFVNTGDGNVWQTDRYQPGMALVDFSNLVARAWYQKYLDDLIKLGVDSFMTDFGDLVPTKDIRYGNAAASYGITFKNELSAENMHNYYSYLYNDAVFEVLIRRFGINNACLFSKSASMGTQAFPVHCGAPSIPSYSSMAAILRGGLSLSLSGFGFWSQDIGGYKDGATEDLYKRWLAFAMLSSHSAFRGELGSKAPWAFGAEAVEIAKAFIHLRLGLMPYLFSASVEASTLGLPMTRAMVLEFPKDPVTPYLDRQYMLGSQLLVAPIMNENGIVRYYVPKGVWTNILTRERVEGPTWKTEQHGYKTIPVLAKPNTLLVTGSNEETTDYDYLSNITVTVFELSENKEASADVYSSDVKNVGYVRAIRKENKITVVTDGIYGSTRLLLANIFRIKGASVGIPEINEWGTLIVFEGNQIDVELL